MLALIRRGKRIVSGLLVVACCAGLGACASQKEPPALVNDPQGKPESTLPWNKQEKWEVAGGIPSQMGETR
jgi:hypothetical protein